MKQSMDQRRAKWAWSQTPDKPASEYKSLAEGTPATILMCGLGQTVAFYLAKKKEPHFDRLLINLATWLLAGYSDPSLTKYDGKTGEDLLDYIMSQDRDRYRMLTEEALEYLNWLKRFAKAKSDE